MGNVVYVCADEKDSSCQACGTFVEPVGEKQWGEMTCGNSDGIIGKYVKVAATNSYLQITEIQIYGSGWYRNFCNFLHEVSEILLFRNFSSVEKKLQKRPKNISNDEYLLEVLTDCVKAFPV